MAMLLKDLICITVTHKRSLTSWLFKIIICAWREEHLYMYHGSTSQNKSGYLVMKLHSFWIKLYSHLAVGSVLNSAYKK